MELFCQSVANEAPELIRQGVRVRMIGERPDSRKRSKRPSPKSRTEPPKGKQSP